MSTTNGQFGTVHPIDITSTMQDAYLDYAMSVIVARALPDVRDGLKPVHRRILYAMSHDLNLVHTGPHKKSARIVGEVLGKYHPHGDTAVYDAMVRMAQDFSLRYPLVDGQGNFGSIDGDNAAAMRYTEARLAEISSLILDDLEKDTVEWHDNFDNSLREPDILPAALPNLLINGSSGIAVGMATNIPPHNLGEIVDGLAHMIDNYHNLEDVTVEDLMRFVKGPDFPTGGILYRFRQDKGQDEHDVVSQGYSVGRGRLILQAKAHFEEMSRNRKRIVITELPYQTNKTALIERIASLVRDGKIEGITDLRDESDRTGMRIVIELTRNVDPKDILADLFKYTPLQQTFGMQMLALVDGQPRMLGLKRMLHLFIQHREEIIRRRSEYDLERARQRAHILEGLLKALDILDEVIATIRRSQRVDTARNNLMQEFKFTQIQAQAILDMQLRRLAALERKKLQNEYDELLKRIAYLEDLLAHPEKVLDLIRADLLAIKEKYGDARRTQIVDSTKGTLTTTDLLPEQDVWVSMAANGDLKRTDVINVTESVAKRVAKSSQVALLNANTLDQLYVFSQDGRSTRVGIHEIPLDKGKHLSEFTDFSRRDSITAAIALPRLEGDEVGGFLFFATELGMVKRVTLEDFLAAAPMDPRVINVDAKDRLGYCLRTSGDQELILVSSSGKSIRFKETDVRSMGLAAAGVGGMKLKKGERIIAAGIVDADGELMTITETGFAKRSALSDYSIQGRNGGGIVTHKPTNRTGDVTSARVLTAGEIATSDTMLTVVTAKDKVSVLNLSEVPQMGRGVQGKQVMAVGLGDKPWAIHVVEMPSDDPSSTDGSGDNNPAVETKNDKSGKGVPASKTAKSRPAAKSQTKTQTEANAAAGKPVSQAPSAGKSAKKPPQQATLDLGLPAADAARAGASRQRKSKSGKNGSSTRNLGGDKDKPAHGLSPGGATENNTPKKTTAGKNDAEQASAEQFSQTTDTSKSVAKAESAPKKASTVKSPSEKATTEHRSSSGKTLAKASSSATAKAESAPKKATSGKTSDKSGDHATATAESASKNRSVATSTETVATETPSVKMISEPKTSKKAAPVKKSVSDKTTAKERPVSSSKTESDSKTTSEIEQPATSASAKSTSDRSISSKEIPEKTKSSTVTSTEKPTPGKASIKDGTPTSDVKPAADQTATIESSGGKPSSRTATGPTTSTAGEAETAAERPEQPGRSETTSSDSALISSTPEKPSAIVAGQEDASAQSTLDKKSSPVKNAPATEAHAQEAKAKKGSKRSKKLQKIQKLRTVTTVKKPPSPKKK